MVADPLHTRWFYLATIVSALIIFALDCKTDLSIADPLLYTGVIWLAYGTRSTRWVWGTAGLVSLLTLLGYFLSPASGEFWQPIANRAIAIFTIWLIAALGNWVRHTLMEQMKLYSILESRVAERTLQLREIEERFELAVRGSTDGLWDWVVVTNEVYYSPRFKELIGYTDAEFPNTFAAFESHLHPDDIERVMSEIDEHLNRRKPYDIEYQLRTKSGEYRWFRARGQAVWNDAGEALRMAGSITDISDRKEVEQALATAVAQLGGVLDAATQFSIIATDSNGIISFFNSGAQNMLGYAAEELVGKLTPQIIHLEEEVIERGKELSQELGYEVQGFEVFVAKAKQGQYDRREWTYVRKDGSHFTVNMVVTAVRNVEGEITGFLGVAEDITERKRNEEEIKLTERRLNLALDSTQMGVWDLDLTQDRAWRSLRHDRVFGYDSLLPEWGYEIFLQHVLPEDIELAKKSFENALLTNNFKMDCRVRWPDQSVHWIAAEGHLFRNEQGEPSRMMGLVANIDERKKSEERFRATIQAAPTAMLVVDADGLITLINRSGEELFGYGPQELIGKPVEILVPERFRANHPQLRQKFLQQAMPRDMGAELELFGLRKNGTEFSIRVGLSPVDTVEGPAAICGVIDITLQKQALMVMKQAKEAAESASRAKSSFLANMSHEIRTPMNGIIGMAQLLSQTTLLSHQRDYLATIDESAHILLRLLNDILDFSKIEAGKLELEYVKFRLSECVARASQMLILRAAEKGLEIVCRVAPEIPDHLCGDPGRIQQVLVNLLGNAVKFTDTGEIFVNVNKESSTDDQVHLHFSVSDTGIGIHADKREQIFRPFEQAESSTTRRFGGTGLGLTISRQLVEMMHGRMWVESELGRGSTFHFTAQFGISPDQHLIEPVELNSLRGLSVLVVDDNLTNRRILNEMLQFWHMEPHLADSAYSAREIMKKAEDAKRPIRLILLDHHMPGEDGFNFAKSLKGTMKDGQCAIIMISSGSSPVDSDQYQKYGISRFMTKPVIASELLNEVLRQFGRFASIVPAKAATASAIALVQSRRVLLVEDNEINRRVAVGLLHSRGHQTVIAENGQLAVEILAEQEFDVVLMDMQMPVMDGYEATAVIRHRERQTGGHIPIVAMTAEALKGDRERCLEAGMDDYVPKPIKPEEMYRAVERFPALCLSDPESRSAARIERAALTSPSEQQPIISSPPIMNAPPIIDAPKESASSEGTPMIDWNFAQEQLGGVEMIAEFSALAKTEGAKLLQEIRRAVENRDAKLIRRFAHTLKGSISYFGFQPVLQAALAMETAGRTESLEDTPALLATLEREFLCFTAALDVGPPRNA